MLDCRYAPCPLLWADIMHIDKYYRQFLKTRGQSLLPPQMSVQEIYEDIQRQAIHNIAQGRAIGPKEASISFSCARSGPLPSSMKHFSLDIDHAAEAKKKVYLRDEQELSGFVKILQNQYIVSYYSPLQEQFYEEKRSQLSAQSGDSEIDFESIRMSLQEERKLEDRAWGGESFGSVNDPLEFWKQESAKYFNFKF